ncbi:MAG: tetratricopeptide repeat protein [Bacteroidetes bacterium]|nr:MAG: tetratricopeptide repeat protein [Bacteroidota bacterium]
MGVMSNLKAKFMRKYSVFICIVLISAHATFAGESPKIDSLKNALNLAKHDTVRAGITDLISFYYSRINPDSGLHYAKQSLEFAQKADWIKGEALAYMELSLNYRSKGKFSEAVTAGERGLALIESSELYTTISALYHNQALCYKAIGNVAKATSYYLKAYKLEQEHGKPSNEAIILENIGNAHFEAKDYLKADSFIRKALSINQSLNDTYGIARNYTNLARVARAKGNLDQAKEWHLFSLKLNWQKANLYSAQVNLGNLGLVYLDKKQYKLAIEYLDSAMLMAKQVNNQPAYYIAKGNLGMLWLDLANQLDKDRLGFSRDHCLSQARLFLEESCSTLYEHQYNDPYLEFSDVLCKVYSAQNEYEQAYNLQLKRNELHKRLQQDNIRLGEESLEIERRALNQLRELEVSNLDLKIERRNRIIISLIALTILINAIVAIVYWRKRNKLNKKRLEQIAQLHSHNIRGPLCRIMGLIDLLERNQCTPEEQEFIMKGLDKSAKQLDKVISDIIFTSSEDKKSV